MNIVRQRKEVMLLVRLERSAEVSMKRSYDALRWAKEVAIYLRRNHGTNTECYAQRFGRLDLIVWYTDWPGLAELDATAAKMNADKSYQGMLASAQAEGLFREGTIIDRLFVSVP